MKYLFFDLECSNCYGKISKVCEYGAILTDENFNIIRSYDIPMSPGNKRNGKFDKSIFKRDPDFNWAYDYDYYFSQPEFPIFYEEIKKIMEEKDVIVFGYSVTNDIKYLNDSCKRYNLEEIQFVAYDLQIIKRAYSNVKQENRGLKGAFIELCGYESLLQIEPHLARDDAKMTMMILKEICNITGYKPLEIIELCENSGYSSNYKEEKSIKLTSNKQVNKTRRNKENQIIWGNFYREYLDKTNDLNYVGKKVTISSKIKDNLEMLQSVISFIKEKDYIAIDSISNSDFIVAVDDSDKERMRRVLTRPYEGKIISVDELMCLC